MYLNKSYLVLDLETVFFTGEFCTVRNYKKDRQTNIQTGSKVCIQANVGLSFDSESNSCSSRIQSVSG